MNGPAGDRGARRPDPGRPGSVEESWFRTIATAVGLAGLGVLVPLIVIGVAAGIVTVAAISSGMIVIGSLLVLQFLLFVVVALGYLRWRGFGLRETVRYLGVDVPSLRDIGLIVVTWLAMVIAMLAAAVAVTAIVPELLGAPEAQPAENPASEAITARPDLILVGIAGMFLIVGPAEEILFRGVVQNRLREGLSAIPAIVVASAIFALAHAVVFVGQEPVAIAMTLTILFVPSLGLGAIYEYTGNIVVPALLHGFHNSVILLGIYAATTMSAPPMAVAVRVGSLGW